MGRVTVSLPDGLEADLDAYAARHDMPVSHVVARALEGFLRDTPAPPPGESDLVDTQQYLTRLVAQLDDVRAALHQMAIAQLGPFADIPESVKTPLPPAPWEPCPGGDQHG